LSAQGLGPQSHDTIARDAIDDAAIDNSPRRPSKDVILGILSLVR
jgi:alcohol dehydrogenase class IV